MSGFGFGFGFSPSVRNGALLNYLPQSILDKLLFYGLYSEIADGKMPNKVGSDWLTVAGSAGSETYQTPNTAPYIAADTDYIWFKNDTTQRITSTSELVGYDLPKTFIKYDNATPYALRGIAILKSGETLTEAEENRVITFFELSIWWSGALNLYGVIKGNRSNEKSTWIPDIVPVNGDCSGLTALAYSSNRIDLSWINGSTNETGISIERSTDGVTYAEIYQTASGITSYTDNGLTIDTRYYYRVRAFRLDQYSTYSSASEWTAIISNGNDLIDSNADGIADYWQNTLGYACNNSIVTGNGFVGNAQRVVENNVANLPSFTPIYTNQLISKGLINGTTYVVLFNYRASNYFRLYDSGSKLFFIKVANIGNAISTSTEIVAGTNQYFIFQIDYIENSWFEIGNIIIKRKVI